MKVIVIIVKKYNPLRMTIPTAGSKAVVVNRIQSIQLRLRNELSVLGVRKLHKHTSNDSTRGLLLSDKIHNSYVITNVSCSSRML